MSRPKDKTSATMDLAEMFRTADAGIERKRQERREATLAGGGYCITMATTFDDCCVTECSGLTTCSNKWMKGNSLRTSSKLSNKGYGYGELNCVDCGVDGADHREHLLALLHHRLSCRGRCLPSLKNATSSARCAYQLVSEQLETSLTKRRADEWFVNNHFTVQVAELVDLAPELDEAAATRALEACGWK